MKFLLDTDLVLWWVKDDERLPRLAREIVEDENNEILVSVVSFWEIAQRSASGEIRVNINELERVLSSDGIQILNIHSGHCAHLATLTQSVGNSFDRMLVAQSQFESILFLTTDQSLTQFGRSVVTV